jgi:hypothetical protein
MSRISTAVRRHWIASACTAVTGIGVVLFVLLYFAPQALFINNRIDEPLPRQARTGAPAASAPQATEPIQLLTGAFRSLEHQTTGTAVLLRLPDGSTLLRLENFSTSNGPDVHVYLSAAPADGPSEAFGRDPIELGSLKANQGNVNYPVPSGVDVTRVKSAVIWCRRFSVGFGVAPLTAVG